MLPIASQAGKKQRIFLGVVVSLWGCFGGGGGARRSSSSSGEEGAGPGGCFGVAGAPHRVVGSAR